MITVVIPALEESATIGDVVRYALRAQGVTEVIVVDDGSVDDTAARALQAGARVVTSTLLGKGASMEDGAREARNHTIVYLDGDLEHLSSRVIERLAEPILAGRADFVKASFRRTGGRVTTLTARPLLATFFPELRFLDQPLGGLVAARRSLLKALDFETDYGADVGLLLDAAAAGARIAQVPIGRIVHDRQPLHALGDMARQVVRAILDRAGRRGRLHKTQIREVEEVERQAQAEIESVLRRLGTTQRLALLPIDGVLVEGSYLQHLARRTRRTRAYREAEAAHGISPVRRILVAARAFRGVAKSAFVRAARTIPLQSGAIATVRGLRRAGYRVGVVSGGSRIVAEVIRRRVFADFTVANLLRFHRSKATGEMTLAPAMRHPRGCPTHESCTGNVVLHLRKRLGLRRRDVVSVGHRAEHLCLLRASGTPVAFRPTIDSLRSATRRVCAEGPLTAVLDELGVA
jgi:phosphoserine phosphatase